MSNSLMARLLNLYGQPDSPNPAAYISEVVTLLKPYSAEELDKAGDYLIRTHKRAGFPKPADIVQACEYVRSLKPAPRRQSQTVDCGHIQFANEKIKSDLGRLAADEGWILSLHDFLRENGREPKPNEIHALKKRAAAFDQVYSKCARGEGGAFSEVLTRWGDSMLARRSKYAAMAYGEQVK